MAHAFARDCSIDPSNRQSSDYGHSPTSISGSHSRGITRNAFGAYLYVGPAALDDEAHYQTLVEIKSKSTMKIDAGKCPGVGRYKTRPRSTPSST
jgi:hypothetical protein